MLYFYKILNLLLRKMGVFLVGKFFIYCGALCLGLSCLGLEPALSRAAHDKTWRWAGKWSLTRIILAFTTYGTICGWWRAELLSKWAGPTWCNDEYAQHFCFHITLTENYILMPATLYNCSTLTLWFLFFLAQLYVWWIKFTLERSQLFQIFHFW